MFNNEKTLIVVYKNEMLINQLKKMVETNDDTQDGKVIGTKDNSINIVAWNEKVWLGNKAAGNIKDKVLFLGNIKGTDKLVPVIDVKFDDCGVKYGWAGNQAILYADVKALEKGEKYLSFVEKLSAFSVPEIIKAPKNAKINASYNREDEIPIVKDKESKKILIKTKKIITKSANAAKNAGIKVAIKTEDMLRDKNYVETQMLFYGLVNLYNNSLEEFANM